MYSYQITSHVIKGKHSIGRECDLNEIDIGIKKDGSTIYYVDYRQFKVTCSECWLEPECSECWLESATAGV